MTIALPMCAAKVRGRWRMGSGVDARCRHRRSTPRVQDKDAGERAGFLLPPRPAEPQLPQFGSGRLRAQLDWLRRRVPIAPAMMARSRSSAPRHPANLGQAGMGVRMGRARPGSGVDSSQTTRSNG